MTEEQIKSIIRMHKAAHPVGNFKIEFVIFLCWFFGIILFQIIFIILMDFN